MTRVIYDTHKPFSPDSSAQVLTNLVTLSAILD